MRACQRSKKRRAGQPNYLPITAKAQMSTNTFSETGELPPESFLFGVIFNAIAALRNISTFFLSSSCFVKGSQFSSTHDVGPIRDATTLHQHSRSNLPKALHYYTVHYPDSIIIQSAVGYISSRRYAAVIWGFVSAVGCSLLGNIAARDNLILHLLGMSVISVNCEWRLSWTVDG